MDAALIYKTFIWFSAYWSRYSTRPDDASAFQVWSYFIFLEELTYRVVSELIKLLLPMSVAMCVCPDQIWLHLSLFSRILDRNECASDTKWSEAGQLVPVLRFYTKITRSVSLECACGHFLSLVGDRESLISFTQSSEIFSIISPQSTN